MKKVSVRIPRLPKRKLDEYIAIYNEYDTVKIGDNHNTVISIESSPKTKRSKCSSSKRKKVEYSGIQLLHSTFHSFSKPVSPNASEKSSNDAAEKSSKFHTEKSSNDNVTMVTNSEDFMRTKARNISEQGPSTSRYLKHGTNPSPFKIRYEELNNSGVDDLINELLNSDDDDTIGKDKQQKLL